MTAQTGPKMDRLFWCLLELPDGQSGPVLTSQSLYPQSLNHRVGLYCKRGVKGDTIVIVHQILPRDDKGGILDLEKKCCMTAPYYRADSVYELFVNDKL